MANALGVNPTRQELLKLKVKLKTSERGYKLLKDKRDGLMKQFMEIIREAKDLRENVEEQLSIGFRSYLFASAKTPPDLLKSAFLLPSMKTVLQADVKNVMSVNVPVFEYKEEGDFLSYGFSFTASELDTALKSFSETLKDMVRLAEVEHSAKLLAEEIEKTRRRVNALEYVFIPKMKETIKYIQAKLGEQERGTIITLMKVKDMLIKQEQEMERERQV
ncbi:MAG: V-type ATP synthase subunit D [Candidatus Uhrbacteria bacterium]